MLEGCAGVRGKKALEKDKYQGSKTEIVRADEGDVDLIDPGSTKS